MTFENHYEKTLSVKVADFSMVKAQEVAENIAQGDLRLTDGGFLHWAYALQVLKYLFVRCSLEG